MESRNFSNIQFLGLPLGFANAWLLRGFPQIVGPHVREAQCREEMVIREVTVGVHQNYLGTSVMAGMKGVLRGSCLLGHYTHHTYCWFGAFYMTTVLRTLQNVVIRHGECSRLKGTKEM